MEIVPSITKRRRVGPFSKRLSFAAIDRRTREGIYASNLLEALYGQMRGPPTPGQQIVAQQIAVKMLRCELMMPRLLSGEELGDHPSSMYLAWSNSVRRDLEALGLLADAPAASPRSLADIMRDIAAEDREAAD